MNFLLVPLQFLIVQCLFRVVGWIFRLAVKLVIYSPQCLTAYFICRLWLRSSDTITTWALALGILTVLLYGLVMLLKSWMVALKQSGSWLWLALYSVLLAYTCIFPVWLIFNAVHQMLTYLAPGQAATLTWIICLTFGVYIHQQYRLLD